ncbi:unnamed protein product [Euphydryas editha]|uniref:Uncharacterized protein n=1 Tax=Euphydryas editha TaxID=104508 RepID=A0AAU9VA24_EUPED|nr:unnamed protein product [Euphydryas editha]
MSCNKLNTFVRNRVSEILDITSSRNWRHVPTHENPADLISRGVEPSAMKSLDLWWSGPKFLQQDITTWPNSFKDLETLPEIKSNISLIANDFTYNLDSKLIKFERFSRFSRLHRCVCYVLRFIKLCKTRSVLPFSFSPEELEHSLNIIIIQSQKESFSEYNLLLNDKG